MFLATIICIFYPYVTIPAIIIRIYHRPHELMYMLPMFILTFSFLFEIDFQHKWICSYFFLWFSLFYIFNKFMDSLDILPMLTSAILLYTMLNEGWIPQTKSPLFIIHHSHHWIYAYSSHSLHYMYKLKEYRYRWFIILIPLIFNYFYSGIWINSYAILYLLMFYEPVDKSTIMMEPIPYYPYISEIWSYVNIIMALYTAGRT